MVLITDTGEKEFQGWQAKNPAPETSGGGGLDTSSQPDASGNVWDSSIQGYRDIHGNVSFDGGRTWSNGYVSGQPEPSPYQGPSQSGTYNEPYFQGAGSTSPYQGPSESGTYTEPYFQGAGAEPAAPDWRQFTEDPAQIQRGRQINALQDWADQQANEPYSAFRQGLINNTLNPDTGQNWGQKLLGGLGTAAGAIDYANPAVGANAIYQATQGNRSLDLNPKDWLTNLQENRTAAQQDVNPYLYAAGATVPYITATAGLGALSGAGGLAGTIARSAPAQFAFNQGSPLAQLGAAEGATFAGRNQEKIPGLNQLPDWAAPVIGGIAGFGAGAALNKALPIAGRSLTSGALSGEQGSLTVPGLRGAKQFHVKPNPTTGNFEVYDATRRTGERLVGEYQTAFEARQAARLARLGDESIRTASPDMARVSDSFDEFQRQHDLVTQRELAARIPALSGETGGGPLPNLRKMGGAMDEGLQYNPPPALQRALKDRGVSHPADLSPEAYREMVDQMTLGEGRSELDRIGRALHATDSLPEAMAQYSRDFNFEAPQLVAKYKKVGPEDTVTLFRAVAKNDPSGIRPGDWVALDRSYAVQHGRGGYGEIGSKIVTSKVPAKDVAWAGTSADEWLYAPQSLRNQELSVYDALKAEKQGIAPALEAPQVAPRPQVPQEVMPAVQSDIKALGLKVRTESGADVAANTRYWDEVAKATGATPRPRTPEDVMGYSPGGKTIVVKEGATPETVAHEVGHAVWDNLPPDLRREWYAIHPIEDRLDGPSRMDILRRFRDTGEFPPTPYASTNTMEDFAESYAAHRLGHLPSENPTGYLAANPAEGPTGSLGAARERFFAKVDAHLGQAPRPQEVGGPPAPPRPPTGPTSPPPPGMPPGASPLGNAARAVGREVLPATARTGIGAGAGAAIAAETGNDPWKGAAIGAAGGLAFHGIAQGAKAAVERNLPKSIAEQRPEAANKLVTLIKAAKPAEKEQAALYSAERSKRVAIGARALEGGTGEQAFARAKGALAGELPKATFAPPRVEFTPEELTSLYNHIKDNPTQFFTKISAEEGLTKLLAGQIPQKAELKKLEVIFGSDLTEAVLGKRSLGVKAWETAVDIANIPRTLVTAWDASLPFRQGAILSPGHPIAGMKAYKVMVEAMASPKFAKLVTQGIETSPNAAIYDRMGIRFLGRANEFAQGNELLPSKLAGKIPGVGGSQRGGTAFMDKLFQNIADGFIAHNPNASEAELKAFGQIVNLAGGRGNLPQFIKSLHGGLSPFFAPAYAISRLQYPPMVLKAMIMGPSNAVRKEAARQLVGFVGTGVAILSLGNKMGVWSVEMDPRSTDWGKGKMGNTRYDFWAGEQQVGRYTAQLITGQRKTSTGQIVAAGSPGDTEFQKRLDVMNRWFKSKQSPLLAGIGEARSGQDFVGNDITVGSALWNHFIPLFIQDMVDAANDSGNPFKALPAAGGTGVQTYTDSDYKKRNDFVVANYGGRTYEQLDPLERQAVDRQLGKLQPTSPEGIAGKEIGDKLRADAVAKQQAIDTSHAAPGASIPKSPDDGAAWRDEYHKLQQYVAGQYDARNTISPFTGKPYGSDMDKAVAEFNAVMDKATPGVVTDFSQVEAWRFQNPAKAALVDQYMADKVNTDRSPMVTQYKQDSKKVQDSGYWQIADRFAPQFAKNLGFTANTQDEFMQSARAKAQANAKGNRVAEEAMFNAYTSGYTGLVTELKQAARAQDPALTAILLRWGWASPSALNLSLAGRAGQ